MNRVDPLIATTVPPGQRGLLARLREIVEWVRHDPRLGRGLAVVPTVLASVGLVLVVPLLRADPGETRRIYEAVAAAARARGDAATAGICLDRLTLLGSQSGLTSPEFGYQLAKLALDLGQLDRAEALLDQVARDDRPVHAPAHVLRAVFLLRQVEGEKGPTRADLRRAERHLGYAVALDPEMPEAHELLGRLALQAGDRTRAELHLQKAARTNPALNYQVADLLHRQGHRQSAEFWARRARDYYRPISEKELDNHPARLLWAASEEILNDHEAARVILLRGLTRADLAEYHHALADSYLAEASALAGRADPDATARLPLLENALRHEPSHQALTTQISAILKSDGLGADRLREQLRALLASGKALATAHLLLGYDAWEHGRADEAKLHWSRAIEADPRSVVVANNLAWALATGSTPDLTRALDLINLALTIDPTVPALLATRGRVLGRLGRWREALAALESALPTQPASRSLHADLADAYTALGEPGLAEQHRRLATAPGDPAQAAPK